MTLVCLPECRAVCEAVVDLGSDSCVSLPDSGAVREAVPEFG